MSTDTIAINISLVEHLIASQFPQWSHLPVKPVSFGGWDNRTFHLGEEMSVRLPSAEHYAIQVEKEHQWLPRFAPLLPLPIPVPVAMGVPANGYPWHWSIYGWIEGENATRDRIADRRQFTIALAEFLADLQQIDPAGGPAPGIHNFFRGGSLSVYDEETRQAIAALGDTIEGEAIMEVWETALNSTWQGSPVWIHGDVSAGNLLVREGHLSAVIDFGCSGVGDPACDLTLIWTLLSRENRKTFSEVLPFDTATWARARGWTLWKALITLVEYRSVHPVKANSSRRVIHEVLADHRTAP